MVGRPARDRTSVLVTLSCQDMPKIRWILLRWKVLKLFSCLAYAVHVSLPYSSKNKQWHKNKIAPYTCTYACVRLIFTGHKCCYASTHGNACVASKNKDLLIQFDFFDFYSYHFVKCYFFFTFINPGFSFCPNDIQLLHKVEHNRKQILTTQPIIKEWGIWKRKNTFSIQQDANSCLDILKFGHRIARIIKAKVCDIWE